MVSVKLFIAAVAAVIVSTTAHAADMPLPAPQIVYQQQLCCDTGHWYLRGDVGVGVQTFSSFDHGQTNSVFVWPASWTIVQQDIQDSAIFGMGIGYAWNNWLRFDVTGEYRTRAGFKSTGSFTEFCPGGTCFDVMKGNISSAVFLANAYVDLGTWWCITPFIGAGIGTSYNHLSSFRDDGLTTFNGLTAGTQFAANGDKANFAWAAHAGLAYHVNQNFTIELAYRYLDMGTAVTGNTNFAFSSPNVLGTHAWTVNDLTSHDLRLGVRWTCCDVPPPPPPLIRKG